MLGYTEKIREIARRLLKECKVEMVIGFAQGSMPMMNEPCFIRSADDADQLVWDSNCGINLANYLTNPDKEEKIGIVAKGCDSRNIVTHIHGKQDQTRAAGDHRRALPGDDRPAAQSPPWKPTVRS
jgi:formate dehydrogenase subunit beta